MKILVHLHLYYQDMLDEMLGYISNLNDYGYDLCVTAVNPCDETISKLKSFKNDVHIIPVENLGYDVAPFVHVLKVTNLNDYDYIIKIHTKQTLKKKAWLPNTTFVKDEWRKLLLGFMETPEQVKKTLALFEDKNVGMVSHYNLIIKPKKEDKVANARADNLIKEIGLPAADYKYVAGTMFIARAALFLPLKGYPCTMSDFEPYNKDILGGSLAHVYERLFGYVIYAGGKKLVSYIPETGLIKTGHFLRRIGRTVGRSLLQVKVNRKNKLIIKLCKIPLCSIKLKD